MTPEFEQYIEEATKYIRWYKARHLVEADVDEHLCTFYDNFIAEGMDHQQAVQAALDHMGTPEDTGRDFNEAFRPRRAWEILPVIQLFAAGGLIVSGISGAGAPTILKIALAYILAFTIGYKLDCQLLMEHQKAVYWSYVVLLGATSILEATGIVDGITPYIFMLFPWVFCGTVRQYILAEKLPMARVCILPVVLPLLLYMVGTDHSQAIPALLACVIVLYFALNRKTGMTAEKKKVMLIAAAVTAAAIALILVGSLAISHTIFNSLDPSGFRTNREEIYTALSGVKPMGAGRQIGSPAPYLENDTLILYIMQVFGIPGLLIILICGYLFVQLTRNRIRGMVGTICPLIATTILIQILIAAILYMFGNLGLGAVSTHMAFPFLSPGYPATATLFLSGILLGAIRDGLVMYDNATND